MRGTGRRGWKEKLARVFTSYAVAGDRYTPAILLGHVASVGVLGAKRLKVWQMGERLTFAQKLLSSS